MFAVPGVVLLVVFVLARPFDFVPALRAIPFLYGFFALALAGILVDARLGHLDLGRRPPTGWLVALSLWCLVTSFAMAPSVTADTALGLAIVLALYIAVGHGVGTLRAYEVLAGAMLACLLWIALVCVEERLSDKTCVSVESREDHSAMGVSDGRGCATVEECLIDPPEPQALYRCEHQGSLGITTIEHGRVRYIGVLHDPNEAALAVSLGVPLALGFYQRKRTRMRLVTVLAMGALALTTLVFSASRGGLLVVAAICGAYLLLRYGKRSLIAVAPLAPLLFLVGGRSGSGATASTSERIETWYEGIEMVRAYPWLGVGHEQFLAHHHLTAHNSFLLAAAETGVLGLVLFTAALYVALRMPLAVLASVDVPEAEPARIWARSLVASFAGLSVGAFFLSFNFHYVFWIHFGLAAALYASVKRHAPALAAPFRVRDALLVVGVSASLLGVVFAISRVRVT